MTVAEIRSDYLRSPHHMGREAFRAGLEESANPFQGKDAEEWRRAWRLQRKDARFAATIEARRASKNTMNCA